MFFTLFITAKILVFYLENLTNNITTNRTNKHMINSNPNVKHLSNNPSLGIIFSFIEPNIKFIIASFGIAFNYRILEI